MALDPRHRVGADRQHGHSACAQVVEHAGDELAAIALALVLAVDLGVLEQDRRRADGIVVDVADLLAIDVQSVAAGGLVVGQRRCDGFNPPPPSLADGATGPAGRWHRRLVTGSPSSFGGSPWQSRRPML